MTKRLVLIGAAALAAACSATAGTAESVPAAPAASLFQTQIAPLLETNCAVCHMTGEEAGGMALISDTAIASLVDHPSQGAPAIKRVAPGDPDNSYIVMKLEGTHIARGGIGAQMPFGAAPLDKKQIELVRQWIAEGAHP